MSIDEIINHAANANERKCGMTEREVLDEVHAILMSSFSFTKRIVTNPETIASAKAAERAAAVKAMNLNSEKL